MPCEAIHDVVSVSILCYDGATGISGTCRRNETYQNMDALSLSSSLKDNGRPSLGVRSSKVINSYRSSFPFKAVRKFVLESV